ncbi:Fc receptor-like protein 5 isoform X2 [Cheilinus undulatus]|uniref:Fc receptor-like protein 5 isoform X2 n=1 Tax=Cheilinus undulatus TaxID=241271 RepID=UPI001BD3B7C1|nr:Fc receptor-like protein 5 isoform X2 [Cheilinus undulatus]
MRWNITVTLNVKMCQTLLCVLGLFLLITPLYGNTEDITPHVTLKSNWDQIFWGETITLRCEIEGSRETEWRYSWRTPQGDKWTTHNEYSISSTTTSDDGEYRCIGRTVHQQNSHTKWSKPFRLTVTGYEPQAQLESEAFPAEGSVTLICNVKPPSSGWSFLWYRGEKTSEIQITQDERYPSNEQIRVTQGGLYWCRGVRGNPPYYTLFSDSVVTNRAVVSLQTQWTEIYRGETITLSCKILDGDDREWEYEWETTISVTILKHSEHFTISVTANNDGDYKCRGKPKTDPHSSTEWSAPVTVRVSEQPKAELRADVRDIPLGGDVTLTCSVSSSSGWSYQYLYRWDTSSDFLAQNANSFGKLRVSEEGLYQCRGQRGNPPYDTEDSEEIMINKKNANEAVLTLHPNWSEVYRGETITLRCEIKDGANTEWEYEWETTSSFKPLKQKEYSITSVYGSHTGNYSCRGRRKSDRSSTKWSRPISLTVLNKRPKAELRADVRDIPLGGDVTLTCSVSSSSGWSYDYLYRRDTSSNSVVKIADLSGQLHVSEEGLYQCRGQRGNSPYYTEDSEEIMINKKNAIEAVLTLHPNWSEVYSGETITLRCEIKDGENTEWEYEWETTSSYKPSAQKDYSITSVYLSHTGNYSCRGRRKSDRSSTKWSHPISLTVLYNSPRPVLTVSPSWLSPGDSVTLSCDVKHPSAGWRFFWYKAIPKLPDDSYNYELLSESSSGTEKHSYIVHGETHTSGYACRAGRGDPVKFTDHSEPKFVWSGGFDSAASLTVSPDRVQHFISDSVSLICVGNSSQWRVKMFDKDSSLKDCSQWDKMTGSTCSIVTYKKRNHVFWCESGSGEFSNAVNITKQNPDIILVTPVHPVTEGDSVSLSCKVRREDTETVSIVFFYQNDKLIQNDTRRELNISAVSKSDEGFYKCQISGKESSQSWMSVKASRSKEFPLTVILIIVGIICGVMLLILLLLLYRHRQSKGSCLCGSLQFQRTNQSSVTNPQEETHNDGYYSPIKGEVCHYETIKGPENSAQGADQSQDVTYSLIELKNLRKKGKKPESQEKAVYSEVKIAPADDVTYTQINHNKGKGKKKKGKSNNAPTEESVYSEVKPDQ